MTRSVTRPTPGPPTGRTGLERPTVCVDTESVPFDTAGERVTRPQIRERTVAGGDTQWIPELEDEAHDYHDLYAAVREEVSVCEY